MQQTSINVLSKKRDLSKNGKTGISLHCHTEFSKEQLDFVPHYAEKLPIVSYFWHREHQKYQKHEGKIIDFSNAYWSPPLEPQMVFDLEQKQINSVNLEALVSLTDHDFIKGNLVIDDANEGKDIPISLEWTVPFGVGFFHLGVHNLAKEQAQTITDQLLQYTFDKEFQTTEHLTELFAMLHEDPHVLIVLNHPIWDIEMIGAKGHAALLANFLSQNSKWIHALEFNGFRSWSENQSVIAIAEALGKPVVAGGDRHGCSPNTVLNLSKANTFAEFVDEIRTLKQSEIVLMPEYERPLHSRQLQSFSEILSMYPDFVDGRRRWFDRVFIDVHDGQGIVSLANHGWVLGGPRWLRMAIKTLGLLGHPVMTPMFRAVRKKKDRVPRSFTTTVKARVEAQISREFQLPAN